LATQLRRTQKTENKSHRREKEYIWGFGGKPEGTRKLGRHRPRWKDHIKMGLRETGWGLWTGLIWLRTETSGVLL
jgi:hypothetical protein